jgi:hypothetical protein
MKRRGPGTPLSLIAGIILVIWGVSPAGAVSQVAPSAHDQEFVCLGFFPPMTMAVRIAKKRRALPLKAALLTQFGAQIQEAALTAPPVVVVTYDSALAVEIVAEASGDTVHTRQSSKGNRFSFDAGSMQWVYNMKIENYDAPGTYTITMISGDETTYRIEPNCTGTLVVD